MKRTLCVLWALFLFCLLTACSDEAETTGKAPLGYTVTFVTNGGSAVAPIRCAEGEPFVAPKAPAKEGFSFVGWYEDAALTRQYTFGKAVAGDMILYAKWQAAPTDTGDDSLKEICAFCAESGACTPYLYEGKTLPLCSDCIARLEDTDAGDAEDGGADDGVGDDAPTPNVGPFTVTLVYMDPLGEPLCSVNGQTQAVYEEVALGADVESDVTGDILAFSDYVIIGFHSDREQAMTGATEADCLQNITSDKTLYSAVREKRFYDVTFLRADGTLFRTVSVKEGSAIDESFPRPLELGTYFKGWTVVGDVSSSLSCIRENVTLQALLGKTDGTVGMVAKGSICVDGVKDPAYMTSGAYLPHNSSLQADRSPTRASATVDADSYVVWDGDCIYLLIEVSDKTLVGRNSAYVRKDVDAWLNDAVELWYSFEQDPALTKNETRIGLDAMGRSKYAPPRSTYGDRMTGIGGGRSTHYEEIEYAVRNCLLGDTGSDLSRTGYVGDAVYHGTGPEPSYMASYIVEMKIPAKTEGKADTAKGARPGTGLLPERDPLSNDPADYAFTPGESLLAGDVIRLNLKINDLMLTEEEMTGALGTYFWDSPPTSAVNGWAGAAGADHTSMLYATDGVGNVVGVAKTDPVFSASGATERELAHYVMLSLNSDERACTLVHSLGNKTVAGERVPTMLREDGSEYVRE